MQRISGQTTISAHPEYPSVSAKRGRTSLAFVAWFSVLMLWSVLPLHGRQHKTKNDEYGLGYSSEIAAPEAEISQAIYDVVNDGIIQGSKEYNKDKNIDKASPADSSPLFPQWTAPGKVFYKVREKVLAPINFKDSNDEGTLAVRYVVESKTSEKTIVRIDAVFAEEFRRTVHPSNGSVESAEFKDVQDHVDTIERQKKQAAESAKHRQEELAQQSLERKKQEAQVAALASSESLEERVSDLRHQLERVVKAPGAQLKSAPFHSATNLKALDPGARLVILIVTPYWYGVETEDGQHGWINRSQVEPLP